MGLFDDIAYGIGASKEKPPGYDQRTADSIEATRGREAADVYRDEKGINPTMRREAAENYQSTPTTLASYGPKPDFFRDSNLDRRIGYKDLLSFGQPLEPFGEGDDRVTQEMIDAYNQRTAFAKNRADQNFMGTGLTQQEYARGQQYGFSTGSDGQMTARTSDRGPAPTITDPNAPDATDPESTIFNPNNAFLRERMRMQQEQAGGILPPAGAEPPITGGPVPLIPEPNIDMPMLPQPRPQMPPQLQGIMGLSDRSNISPAMRYAAENYYRLGGRQMMNDEYERGRAMIQGQSV
jgi:hypothetical protein